ncbi:MAG: glucose-1-phosphate adenylyltransferase subunit GlgD [Clostridia bacterium]|nr:glucose-1-phosphate adenylyltransferase subunit GlgD [Clostridia bacterium]
MAAKNVLGIIFSNAYDEVMPELTSLRTMGSVPFAGRYRLIDFQLSNMVNAGIPQVGVITKGNYRSLMDHVGNGKPWDLSRKRGGMTILPPFNTPETGMFKGKADSLFGSITYISDSNKDYVLLADCNVICNIDYDNLVKAHIAKNADITIAYAYGIPPATSSASEFVMDENGRITDDRYVDCYSSEVNYSLKIMVIGRTLLERLLYEAHSARVDDFETIIRKNLSFLAVYGYEVKGFVRTLESLRSYYEISMELLKPENRKALFASPVYTKVRDQFPAVYGISAKVKNSLIADGCKIDGEVENCILFRGVTVAKGAKLKNCIVMQDSYIGDNAEIECVIADKSVVVKPNKKLCGASNYPIYVGKGIVI